MVRWVGLVLAFLKRYVSFLDCIANPIFGCGIKITPEVDPLYVWLEKSSPCDSKNVSFVDVGIV